MATVADHISLVLTRADPQPCPLCGASQATRVWFRGLHAVAAVAADLAPAGAPGWWIVRCSGCDLVRVDPAPQEADLPALYDETYFTGGIFGGSTHAGGMSGHLSVYDSLQRRQASLRWHGRRLAHLERFVRPDPASAGRGRLLDVGCGAGYFLDAAREAGWQVRGVELSEAAVRVGREKLGLDIFQGTLAGAALPAAAFDVVTLFEVLEHLRDPGSALAEARRLLRPGGLLAIQVPNDLNAYRNQAFRRDNRWWVIPPLHLFYFTAATLAHWLRKLGFRPVHIGTTGSLGTDALTLLRAGGRRPGRLLTAGVRRLPGPLDWWLRRLGRHTELLVYAHRDAA